MWPVSERFPYKIPNTEREGKVAPRRLISNCTVPGPVTWPSWRRDSSLCRVVPITPGVKESTAPIWGPDVSAWHPALAVWQRFSRHLAKHSGVGWQDETPRHRSQQWASQGAYLLSQQKVFPSGRVSGSL